ncbi:MAG: phenylalanine--tRNA ligase subunit alpha, partial [Clostridia bacterium]|nr:phenylalanine--tRNA ligase subunit alpha [Clostridia bacterium]
MKEKLEALLREGSEKIQNAKNEAELQQIKGAYLGKQGSVTELMKEMPKLDP